MKFKVTFERTIIERRTITVDMEADSDEEIRTLAQMTAESHEPGARDPSDWLFKRKPWGIESLRGSGAVRVAKIQEHREIEP